MLPELQQPNIVGNFLSSYGTAQAQQQAQQDREFNKQRVMRQDQRAEQQFDMEMDANQLGMAMKRAEALNGILMQVNPADPMSLEKAKSDFVNMFGGDPQAVAGVTMDRVKSLRAETDLKLQELRARIRQADASASLSEASADKARRDATTNGGYPVGYRKPPDGIQGKDYKVIEGYSQNADAAANIASVYAAAKDALNQNMTGPGAGVKRTVASVVGLLPNLGVEEFLTGENRTKNIIDNYDAVEQAALLQGIEGVKGLGGSDTQLELLTAIRTGVNNEASPEENRRRVTNQLAAANILSKKAQLASEWVNRFGSLQYAAPDGTTWQKYWPQYQRDNWNAHLRAEAEKERIRKERAKGGGAPSVVDAASEIISRTKGPNNGR